MDSFYATAANETKMFRHFADRSIFEFMLNLELEKSRAKEAKERAPVIVPVLQIIAGGR